MQNYIDPQWINGCISGSAPVISFVGMQPPIDFNYYAQIMTFDASSAVKSFPARFSPVFVICMKINTTKTKGWS